MLNVLRYQQPLPNFSTGTTMVHQELDHQGCQPQLELNLTKKLPNSRFE